MNRPKIAAGLIITGFLAACSQSPSEKADAITAAPAANSVDTISGTKFADFKGDASAGETAFVQCKACHVIDADVNRMGPSLHAVVGRKAGSIEGFHYSAAAKASEIVWSEAKLFEFLESPRRVVPGTTMGFAGISDPQKRADIIAYLKANGS